MGHHEISYHHGHGYDQAEAIHAEYYQEQGASQYLQAGICKTRTLLTWLVSLPRQAILAISKTHWEKLPRLLPRKAKQQQQALSSTSTSLAPLRRRRCRSRGGGWARDLDCQLADVPGLGSGSFAWTELYSGLNGTGSSVSQKLDSHDMAVFRK